jgi:hypothetical protein
LREACDVTEVIFAGQSNALGFGNTGPAPYSPTPQVQIWALQADGSYQWNYMRPGVNTGMPANPTVWGPEVQFANDWLGQHAGDGTYLWVLKVTKGSTGLAADPAALDWSPHSSGEMYDLAVSQANAAMHNLDGTPYAFSRYDALFWMQGEQDALVAGKAAAYGANLGELLTDARADMMHDPAGYVGVGRITDSAALPDSLDVRQAEWQVDQADAHMESFKTIGFAMQPDGLHYAAAGHIALGDGFFDNWVA